MLKKTASIVLCIMMFLIVTIVFEEPSVHISNIVEMPENTEERFAMSKALQNGTSFKDELEKENRYRQQILLRSNDEYVDYITKGQYSTPVRVNREIVPVKIYTEARCIVSKNSVKVVRVEDFGEPYVDVEKFSDLSFEHGGFNVDRLGDTCARISSTGQIFLKGEVFSVGIDVLSVSFDNIAKSKVQTIFAKINW